MSNSPRVGETSDERALREFDCAHCAHAHACDETSDDGLLPCERKPEIAPRSCPRCSREIGHAAICPTCEKIYVYQCQDCEHSPYCLSGRLPTKGCKDEPEEFITKYLSSIKNHGA